MTVKLFLGLPGTGKTQAMIDFISLDLHNPKREERHLFFAVDRAAEFGTHDEGLPNPRWRNAPPEHVSIAPEPQKFADWLQSDEWNTHIENGGLVLFRYPWDGLAVAQWAKAIGNITYVDDEIDLVAVYKNWDDNALKEFIHRGRHLPNADGIPCHAHIMGAGRRCENLHTDITSMADEVLTFRVSGKHTVKRILDEGFVSEEQEMEMRTQPNLHYFIWRNTGETGRGKLDNPFSGKQGAVSDSRQTVDKEVHKDAVDTQTEED